MRGPLWYQINTSKPGTTIIPTASTKAAGERLSPRATDIKTIGVEVNQYHDLTVQNIEEIWRLENGDQAAAGEAEEGKPIPPPQLQPVESIWFSRRMG